VRWNRFVLIAALLVIPALRVTASLLLGNQVTSSPMACAVGPNYVGTILADAQTAGFTTCAFNSDFATSGFNTVSSWLGGDKMTDDCGAGLASGPVWYNTSDTPCSDYSIITDGGSHVLDIQWNAADVAAGRTLSEMQSIGYYQQPGGHIFPTGMYLEMKFRFTTTGWHALDGASQTWLLGGPFKWLPQQQPQNVPFVEWDCCEIYPGSNASISAGSVPWDGVSGILWGDFPSGKQICSGQTACNAFDPTTYHTYGMLVTTDGNTATAQCSYVDGNKVGCVSSPSVSPATTPWQVLETLIIQLGPGGNTEPSPFNGPVDLLISYIRVFSCSGWNASNAVCPGTLVTN
jgi:hypothetical protein